MANSVNCLNIIAAGIPVFDGISTFNASTTTQYNMLVGGTVNSIGSIAPSATSGVPLISQGSSANPTFGTAVVLGGGTGATTLANNGVLIGQGTSAITATAVGTTGQVLTGVTGSAPVWAAPAASSISITGNSGGALVGASFTFTGGTTGLTFAGSGSTQTLGGTLAIANGGTNATSMATTAGVVIFDGTRLVTTSAGTTGQVLTSNGAGVAPTYQNTILTATVVLTSAQVKAIRATPITIVSAAGAGTYISVLACRAKLTYGGTNVFTAAASQTILLYYNAATQVGTCMDNASIVAAANTTYSTSLTSLGSRAATLVENLPVNARNSIATEISGNAANNNTITIVVTYQVLTI